MKSESSTLIYRNNAGLGVLSRNDITCGGVNKALSKFSETKTLEDME